MKLNDAFECRIPGATAFNQNGAIIPGKILTCAPREGNRMRAWLLVTYGCPYAYGPRNRHEIEAIWQSHGYRDSLGCNISHSEIVDWLFRRRSSVWKIRSWVGASR